MIPLRYRSKPKEVLAVFWDGSSVDAADIARWVNDNGGEAQFLSIPSLTHSITITTLEGEMYALPGDWIVQGTRGEFYPCKPGPFADSYELNGTTLASKTPPARAFLGEPVCGDPNCGCG